VRTAFFDFVLDIAVLSAQLRIQQALGLAPSHEDEEAWQQRNHPYVRLNDTILRKMRVLGRMCRNTGVDVRTSAFWPLLAFQHIYIEKYEFRRKVRLEKLTPDVIHEGLYRGNKLLWNDWEIYPGSSRGARNVSGRPTWEQRIWISSPTKGLEMMSGISRTTSHAIYRHIMGAPFPCQHEITETK
jgi:hypothetical protein